MPDKIWLRLKAGTFQESQHPREAAGKFTDKPGGQSSQSQAVQEPERTNKPSVRSDFDVSEERQGRLDAMEELGAKVSHQHLDRITGIGSLEDHLTEHGVRLDKEVTEVSYNRDGSGYVTVEARSSDGKVHIERTIRYGAEGTPRHISNDKFFIDESLTGKGIGAAVFSAQVNEASKAGFSHIETVAGRNDEAGANKKMNGYYTWPRLGYDGSVPSAIGEKAPQSVQDSFAARRAAHVPGGPFGGKGYLVSDFMKSPEGREYWKKNGIQMDMDFDLSENSQSRRVLDEYTRAKGIKKELRWRLNLN